MKININNTKKLNAELEKVQSRSQVRTLCASEVRREINGIEKRLHELKIAKKDWKGMKFAVSPYNQIFPNAYNGIPEGTSLIVEYCASGFFITRISRENCNRGGKNRIIFNNESDYQKFYKF